MEIKEYLESVRRDADRVVAAGHLGLRQPVPSCPEWDVAALVTHLGDIHRWVTEVINTRATERIQRESDPDRGDDLLAWFAEGADTLVETLESTPPDAEVWNWAGEAPLASFWSRRMAHEAAVHRWDAQNAHGVAEPFDGELASDGIAEMLEIVLVRIAQWKGVDPIPGLFHVHCTDVAGEWAVTMNGTTVDVRREHAKGEVAWRGAASDLLLAVTNRVPAAINSGVEILGDTDLSQRWSDALQF